MPERESGGYYTRDADSKIREIAVLLTPTAISLQRDTEQAFTVPGVLSTERVVAVSTASQAIGAASTIGLSGARVTAASQITVNMVNPTTVAVTPTSEVVYLFYVAPARAG